jgi:hypothetical protein
MTGRALREHRSRGYGGDQPIVPPCGTAGPVSHLTGPYRPAPRPAGAPIAVVGYPENMLFRAYNSHLYALERTFLDS